MTTEGNQQPQPAYSATMNVKENGTKQIPSVEVSVTTGRSDIPARELVDEVLRRYHGLVVGVRPDDPRGFKVEVKATPFA